MRCFPLLLAYFASASTKLKDILILKIIKALCTGYLPTKPIFLTTKTSPLRALKSKVFETILFSKSSIFQNLTFTFWLLWNYCKTVNNGTWSQQLHYCICRGTRQKLQGHQKRWTHTTQGWIHPYVLQQLNISTSQIRRKIHIEKVALLFSTQCQSLLHSTSQLQFWKQPSTAHALHHLTTAASYRDLHPWRHASPEEDARGGGVASWAAATDLLDIVDLLGTVSRQDERWIVCYHNIILNAHTNATKSLWGAHIIFRDIKSWKKGGN